MTIKGKDIVCIGNTNWHGKYSKSTVQILSRIARNNRVVYVEYPHTLKDLLFHFLGKKVVDYKRMLGIKKRLQVVETNNESNIFHLVVPAMLPVDFIQNNAVFSFFFKWNVLRYKKVLKKVLAELDFKNTIVITAYNPFYGLALMGKLNEATNIYYCYDGIGERRHGKRIYSVDTEFSHKVDTIITSSDYLKKSKLKLNANTFVVKNGVDYDFFQKFAKKGTLNNKRKKIGYLGSIDHRFDLEIVVFAVKELPDYDFEFTGDLRNEQAKVELLSYPNVYFHEAIDPSEVPKVMASL